MKKLVVFVLSVGMLFSLAACGGSKVDDKALDALEKGIQKFSEVKSADYAVGINTKDPSTKEPVEINLTGSFVSEPKLQLKLSVGMNTVEQDMEDFIQLFIKEESIYFNMMNLSKSKLGLGALSKSLIDTKTEEFKLDKADMKKNLKEASIKGNSLKLVLDEKKVNDEIKKQTKKPNSIITSDIKMKEVAINITLKKGFIENATISFDVSQTVDKVVTAAKADMTFGLKNINAVKEVTLPELNDYVDSGTIDEFLINKLGSSLQDSAE